MDKVPLEDIYNEDDEAAAAKMLTGMLLRLRDKRAAGLLRDGILSAWYAELTDSAKSSLYHELIDPVPGNSQPYNTKPVDDRSENHSSVVVESDDDVVDYKHIYMKEKK